MADEIAKIQKNEKMEIIVLEVQIAKILAQA